MKAENFGMFTDKGNYMVSRIADAARELAGVDGPENPTRLAWQWAKRELEKLATADEFGEAMDTEVRELVYDHVVENKLGVDFYA